ncbi:MAG: hypothetical protein HQ478_09270 [Chloroflexi bacterium]|nr:hypothetical protein [Chloroflexota bacterium]
MSGHIVHWSRWLRPSSRWPSKLESQRQDEGRKLSLHLEREMGQSRVPSFYNIYLDSLLGVRSKYFLVMRVNELTKTVLSAGVSAPDVLGERVTNEGEQ